MGTESIRKRPSRTGLDKPSDIDDGTKDESTNLKRELGLVSGSAIIIGTMIGSGIFVSPAGIAAGAGSVGLSLVLWMACGLVSTLGALVYAELGTLIPESGCEYTYLMTAYGPVLGYLSAWVGVTVIRPSNVAIISLTCAEYVMAPLFSSDGCGPAPELYTKLATVVIILILAAINSYSVKLAANVQVVTTVAKLLALLIIIIGGVVKLAQGHTAILTSGFDGTNIAPGPICIGLYSGMWAYDGWNNLNYAMEEVRDPHKTLPRSILLSVPLVMAFYLLVNISYFTVMSVEELTTSPAVALAWGSRVMPSVPWLIPLCVAMSTFGAANGTLFAGGRLSFVASRNGHIMKILSMVHVTKFTPMPSVVFCTLMSILYVIPGDIVGLIDFFSFIVWMVYALGALSCIVLRYRMKDAHRPYKVPIVFAYIVFIVSTSLVLVPLIDSPQWGMFFAFLFILSGLAFYVPFVHYKKQLPYVDDFTKHCQLMMQCSPPTEAPRS